MNSQRQVSTFAIALLMAGLVIVVGLSLSTCYATPIIATPITNETDIVIVTIPAPITNETGHGISVIDPLVILNKKIARIDAELISLSDKLNMVCDAMAEIGELGNRTDILSMEMEELRGELVSTNRELKMMRNSMNVVTILFGAFSVIAIGIVAMTRRP